MHAIQCQHYGLAQKTGPLVTVSKKVQKISNSSVASQNPWNLAHYKLEYYYYYFLIIIII